MRRENPELKVLHVIPGVAPRYGGPSQAIFQMCRAIQEEKIQTLIATTDADGSGSLPVQTGIPISYGGSPTIFFPRQHSEAFKCSRPLGRWLDQNVARFDVVHIHAVYSYSSLAAAKACRRRGITYVVRPLGSLDPWSLRQRRLLKRILWHCGVGLMLRAAAAIHYTTAEEKRLAEEALGLSRGIVIPVGIDINLLNAPTDTTSFRQRYPSIGDNPFVVMLSRLHPKKALELFLEVFLDLTQEPAFRQWKLVIAGDGKPDYVAHLRRIVSEREGDARVIFVGWLQGLDKTSALQAAALLALPSYQENFGISVVEAMACGVPVLVSAYVNLADEIESAGGGWVADLNRTSLLTTLSQALQDNTERERRGAAGRELVRARFTWPAVAAELTQLYNRLTFNHSNQP